MEQGRLNSYLIEITEKVLKATDPETGKAMVDVIVDSAGQKGTGKWSAIEAQNLAVAASGIEAAVSGRVLSSLREERLAAEKLFGLPALAEAPKDKAAFIADLENALLAAKIAAYAQGFAVMSSASEEFNWSLPMPTIARIWRAGCIIRSQFLDEITSAFTKDPNVANLVVTPAFAEMVKETDGALRRVVAMRRCPVCRFRRSPRRSPISTPIVVVAARQTSSRRSATSSARMASTASTARIFTTAPGPASSDPWPIRRSTRPDVCRYRASFRWVTPQDAARARSD